MLELIALMGLLFIGVLVFGVIALVFGLLKIIFKILLIPLGLLFGLLKVVLLAVFGIVALVLAPLALLAFFFVVLPFLLVTGLIGLGWAVAT